MNKLTKKIYKKLEKDLQNKIGLDDTDFLLDKFGRSGSFLDTVCLLPKWFSDSFSDNKSRHNLPLLGEANLKAWIGYTLYDYLRDGKIPKERSIKMISVANIYTNDALSIFIDRADSYSKKKMITNLFKKIDMFYLKQEAAVKFIDFDFFCSIIHEKSIAAAISALLVVPNSADTSSFKDSLNFFKFYFTARQLSDDLDDYKKDLKAKINTPVTLMIEKGLKKTELIQFIRKQIDKNFNQSIKLLKNLDDFNSELFIKNYVKPC